MSYDELRYNLFLNINQNKTQEARELFDEMITRFPGSSDDSTQRFSVDTHLNKFEWTALHTAAYKGNSELVNFFISRGADVSRTNANGYTPLMLAEYKKNTEVAKIFERLVPVSAKKEVTIEVHSFQTATV